MSFAAILFFLFSASYALPTSARAAEPTTDSNIILENAPASPSTSPTAQPWSIAKNRTRRIPAYIPVYNPASPNASLSTRIASWDHLHIQNIGDKYEVVGDHPINDKELERYYQNSGAEESSYLNRKCAISRYVWLIAAPLAGVIAGAAVGVANASSSGANSAPGSGIVIIAAGEVAGGIAGITVGGLMALVENHRHSEFRREAAESFNQKLLRDLRLEVQPTRGGERLGLQTTF